LHRSTLSREVFGTLDDGAAVEAVTLVNANGMSVRIIGYGASIQSVRVPDRYGELADVTAGYATLDDYIRHPQFFGSTVGRVANRVAGARFILNGIEYDVPANDGTSSLHGGTQGFDKVNWTITTCDDKNMSVSLQYISPDGDQGYPGTLRTIATYSLDDDNMLTVEYRATTDALTVVNLSNHAYWNLGGEGSQDGAMDHQLAIYGEEFLPVDARLVPTGERRRVDGTAFDFRRPKALKTHLRDAGDAQIGFGRGYDHNWIIGDRPTETARPVAYLADPHSGRTMTLLSNQPGLQFYSGNFFDGSTSGKAGKFYRMGDAIALEPQQFPDTPNQPSFGSIELAPGDVYSNIISWRFGIIDSEERHDKH
jgi:aldose 1-epimerase